jgi:hypothetical protein
VGGAGPVGRSVGADAKSVVVHNPFLYMSWIPDNIQPPRRIITTTETKAFFFYKIFEEFAGGRTDEWMNVDESIIIS